MFIGYSLVLTLWININQPHHRSQFSEHTSLTLTLVNRRPPIENILLHNVVELILQSQDRLKFAPVNLPTSLFKIIDILGHDFFHQWSSARIVILTLLPPSLKFLLPVLDQLLIPLHLLLMVLFKIEPDLTFITTLDLKVAPPLPGRLHISIYVLVELGEEEMAVIVTAP